MFSLLVQGLANDLLTVRALRALEQVCDVVVHDQLVSPAVLNIIHPNAKKILLSEILECSSGSDTGLTLGTYLAECATNGHTVVRLKGGDPTIFARLREEIEPLIERSISFEIVPGITSATQQQQRQLLRLHQEIFHPVLRS